MKQRAFTLVELLVVIAIIALLISILAPSLGTVKDIAKMTICSTNTKSTGMATILYCESNKGWIPPLYPADYGAGSLPPPWRWMYTADGPWKALRTITWNTRDNYGQIEYYQSLGLLYSSGLVANASLFYCPSRNDPSDEFSRAFYPPVWDSSGVPDVGGGIRKHRTSYILTPLMTSQQIAAPNILMMVSRMDKMDSGMVLLMDLIAVENFNGTMSATPHSKPAAQWNIAFPDAHVERRESNAVNKIAVDLVTSGFETKNDWNTFVLCLQKMLK